MKICEVFMVYFNFSKMASEFGKSLDWVDSVCKYFFEGNFENHFTDTFLGDIDYILFREDEGSGVKAFTLTIRDFQQCPVFKIRVSISNYYDIDDQLPFDPVWYAEFFSCSFSLEKKSLVLELIDRSSFRESWFTNADLEVYGVTDFYDYL